MKGPYNGGSSFAPFFRHAAPRMMDPNPQFLPLASISIRTRYLPGPLSSSLLLRIALRGVETSPLFKFCSKFSSSCCVTFWKRLWAIFLLRRRRRRRTDDHACNNETWKWIVKKRLPSSVHRRWDPQRSWWRAESAGDFGNTAHRSGAGFAATTLYQPETKRKIYLVHTFNLSTFFYKLL